MKKELIAFNLLLVLSVNSYASIPTPKAQDVLLQKYMTVYESKTDLENLKKDTLKAGKNSVASLIEVMKNSKYPDKNRWIATFMLGEVAGTKSSPFIAKFLRHPSWVMRMASLKTLNKLKEERYIPQYAMLLNDESLLVREQALENLRSMNASKYAPQIWSMLYDKKNYHQPSLNGKALKYKRTNIIKNVITTIGDLKFADAKKPLLKMVQKDKYNDIFPEMDYALSKITGSNSPEGDMKKKRMYWKRSALDATIE